MFKVLVEERVDVPAGSPNKRRCLCCGSTTSMPCPTSNLALEFFLRPQTPGCPAPHVKFGLKEVYLLVVEFLWPQTKAALSNKSNLPKLLLSKCWTGMYFYCIIHKSTDEPLIEVVRYIKLNSCIFFCHPIKRC